MIKTTERKGNKKVVEYKVKTNKVELEEVLTDVVNTFGKNKRVKMTVG